MVSLFEKAYIILFCDSMDRDGRRRWLSWEDDMREWCRMGSFRDSLPELLEGEDQDFSVHILAIARAEGQNTG